MSIWLLVDTTYLCHRAWHTTGHLMYEQEATGVAYGIIQTLEELSFQFAPTRTILAFDGKHNLRRGVYPQYKAQRREKEKQMSEDEKESFRIFYQQVDKLRDDYLPMMGYNNVIVEDGYEADDIIAKVAQNLPQGVIGIIVTADNDLFQCISDNVHYFNPHKKTLYTLKDFCAEWKIMPELWASVKALAGCKSDNIDGIVGIGEKKAAAWYSGELKQESKTWHKISENLDIHNANIKLTKLPYPGLGMPDLYDDKVTETKKQDLKIRLGIKRRPFRREGDMF